MSSRPSRVFVLVVAVSLAFGAFAAANASALSVSLSKSPPLTFSTSGGPSSFDIGDGAPMICSATSGSGRFSNSTSGEMQMTLTGCQKLGNYKCTTAGQTAGTVVTSNIPFKLVYLNAAKTEFGVLLTPPASGSYAEFTCVGTKYFWRGSGHEPLIPGGLLLQISSPRLNVAAGTFVLSPSSSNKIEGEGLPYWTTFTASGGGASAVEVNATVSNTFAGGATGTFIP